MSKVAVGLVSVLVGLWLASGPAMAESGDDVALQGGREALMTAVFEVELSGDVNFDFSRLMVAHQTAGVQLGQLVLDQTEDERLSRVADLIVEKHQDAIEEFNTWLGRYDEANPDDDAELIRQTYQTVLEAFAQGRDEFRVDDDADQLFANAMVWHYELIVSLGQVMLNHSVDAQLRILAGDVVRDANRDIAELRNWMQSQELEASQ